jgi:hypothetical protein
MFSNTFIASLLRHAELVSASISLPAPSVRGARWTLKQVQGDEFGERWVFTKTLIANRGEAPCA